MTDVMDEFTHLNQMSQVQLFERRTQLVGSAPNGDYRQLSDEALQELVAIHRILRRSSGGKSPRAKDEIPTLDML
jgi:hypothetical protein